MSNAPMKERFDPGILIGGAILVAVVSWMFEVPAWQAALGVIALVIAWELYLAFRPNECPSCGGVGWTDDLISEPVDRMECYTCRGTGKRDPNR